MLRSLQGGTVFAQADLTSGPVCVMLHGWARSSEDFASLNSELVSAGLSTIRLDLPGFGASPPPPKPIASREYATIVLASIDEALSNHSEKRYFVVGHSFGGRIALEVAALAPSGLQEIFVSGVPMFRDKSSPKPALRYRLVRRGASMGIVGQARLARYRERYGSPDYRGATGVMREVFVRVVNEDYRDTLARIEVPVHLIWGESDTSAPLEGAERAVALVGHGTLEVIARGSHFDPIFAPDALAKGVIGASQRLSSGAGGYGD